MGNLNEIIDQKVYGDGAFGLSGIGRAGSSLGEYGAKQSIPTEAEITKLKELHEKRQAEAKKHQRGRLIISLAQDIMLHQNLKPVDAFETAISWVAFTDRWCEDYIKSSVTE